jgi:hypothetical protein
VLSGDEIDIFGNRERRTFMTNATIESELHEQLNRLPLDRQRQVLDFACALVAARPRGVVGQQLLAFAGAIPANDLVEMSHAIDEGCGRIDDRDW